jgi:hypothetical protein
MGIGEQQIADIDKNENLFGLDQKLLFTFKIWSSRLENRQIFFEDLLNVLAVCRLNKIRGIV